jgi:hypothetical protein
MEKESNNNIMNFTQAVFGNCFGILFYEVWSHQSWHLVLLCILHSIVSYGIIFWGSSADSS